MKILNFITFCLLIVIFCGTTANATTLWFENSPGAKKCIQRMPLKQRMLLIQLRHKADYNNDNVVSQREFITFFEELVQPVKKRIALQKKITAMLPKLKQLEQSVKTLCQNIEESSRQTKEMLKIQEEMREERFANSSPAERDLQIKIYLFIEERGTEGFKQICAITDNTKFTIEERREQLGKLLQLKYPLFPRTDPKDLPEYLQTRRAERKYGQQ